MKKQLPKAMKTVKGDDRLLLIGTSSLPFDAKVKPLTNAYNKIILVPRPDYASRHCKRYDIKFCKTGLNNPFKFLTSVV